MHYIIMTIFLTIPHKEVASCTLRLESRLLKFQLPGTKIQRVRKLYFHFWTLIIYTLFESYWIVNLEHLLHYHSRMRIGNNFTQFCLSVCVSVCMSVCVSVCSGYDFWTAKARNFIFSTQVHLKCRGHWVKVKCQFLYVCISLKYN